MAEAASEVATDRMILEEAVVVSGEYIIFLRRVLGNVRVLERSWGFTSIYIYYTYIGSTRIVFHSLELWRDAKCIKNKSCTC